MTGISRDTLRFYEKKGIIHSHKKENGYRYYSEEDIFVILNVLFRRKINLSLEKIGTLFNRESSYIAMQQLAERKILEEEAALEYHRQVLVKLNMTRDDCKKVERCLNRFSVCPFEKSYIRAQYDNFGESMISWFQMSKLTPGLELTYIYDSFRVSDQDMKPGKVYLMMKVEIGKKLNIGLDLTQALSPPHVCSSGGYETKEWESCIYTIIESDSRIPHMENVRNAMEWGEIQGF